MCACSRRCTRARGCAQVVLPALCSSARDLPYVLKQRGHAKYLVAGRMLSTLSRQSVLCLVASALLALHPARPSVGRLAVLNDANVPGLFAARVPPANSAGTTTAAAAAAASTAARDAHLAGLATRRRSRSAAAGEEEPAAGTADRLRCLLNYVQLMCRSETSVREEVGGRGARAFMAAAACAGRCCAPARAVACGHRCPLVRGAGSAPCASGFCHMRMCPCMHVCLHV